ncbi:MAG TPA: hypothetical protein VNG93_13915 [Candidatus Dormibacteraeota bacterium]|nr:hypothetical protein [Candidatus Dormibacteraeota bacterium]
MDLVTPGREGVPVVLAELVKPPRPLELFCQSLDHGLGLVSRFAGMAVGGAKALAKGRVHLIAWDEPGELLVKGLLKHLAPDQAGLAPGQRGVDRRAVAPRGMAAVVAEKVAPSGGGLPVHRPSAAGAEQDRGQGVGVLGPGLAGAPQVAPLDLQAGLPGRLPDQGRMAALDELAIDQDHAQVGGVADQVLEDVAREDDRLGAVVVGLLLAARRLHALPVQVLGQGPEAEAAAGIEPEDLPDHRSSHGILSDLASHAQVALGDGAQQMAVAAQVMEVVANPSGDLLALLLGDDGLDLPGEPIEVADQATGVEDQDPPLGHLGHEAEELKVIAVKSVGVVEGDGADRSGRHTPDPLHQRQIAGPPGGLLTRPVGILKVLEGEFLQLTPMGDRVELLVERGPARPSLGVEVGYGLPGVNEQDRGPSAGLGRHPQPLQGLGLALPGPFLLAAHSDLLRRW